MDHIWKYDVFLSFRGEDTRKTITDHLYEALCGANIRTFRDDGDQLQRGRAISFELVKAIEESRISIVIFSKNYGNSSWCLQELVKILDCMKKGGQLVLPVFFNVDPSEVRKVTGDFGKAFTEVEKVNSEDQVQKWRIALGKAASLAGWDLRTDADGYEFKLIKKVVREVQSSLVNHKMVDLEEEEAKLRELEETNKRKMIDLQKQLESIKQEAQILSSKRSKLCIARSSLEDTIRIWRQEA